MEIRAEPTAVIESSPNELGVWWGVENEGRGMPACLDRTGAAMPDGSIARVVLETVLCDSNH